MSGQGVVKSIPALLRKLLKSGLLLMDRANPAGEEMGVNNQSQIQLCLVLTCFAYRKTRTTMVENGTIC